jgi:hypothetical protein
MNFPFKTLLKNKTSVVAIRCKIGWHSEAKKTNKLLMQQYLKKIIFTT